jgi:GTPase SAR1 family protein
MSEQQKIKTALAKFETIKLNENSEHERLWVLLSGLHRDPQVREWITLESVSLLPYLWRNNDEWVINVLVSTVRQQNRIPKSPWALLVWSWPAGRLLAMVDISTECHKLEGPELRTSDVCTHEYCVALQEELENGTAIDLPTHLKQLYAKVLNQPLLGYIESDRKLQSSTVIDINLIDLPKVSVISQEKLVLALSESRTLLRDCALEDLLPWWRRIQSLLETTHYDVAVAGEFSRGKSTLINKLIGAEILTVGDLPTTAMPARVRFGESNRIWLRERDGRRQEVDSTASKKPEHSDTLQEGIHEVEVPSSWLKESGLQLIDTPGVGSLDGARSSFATEVISVSDATLVAVSATMPLSLTEKSFIEQEVLGGAIPRIAVVITRLDQVGEEERVQVVAHIYEKVADWAPSAEVWSTYDSQTLQSETTDTVAGIPAIKKRLSEWSSDPDHHYRRMLQLSTHMEQLLSAAESVIHTRIDFNQHVRNADAEQLQEAMQNLNRQGLQWGQIRNELGHREIKVEEWLDKKLREGLNNVGEYLAEIVSKHSNPHEWWETEFPVTFKKQFGKHMHQLERTLQNGIAKDIIWLDEKAQAEMSWSVTTSIKSDVVGDATADVLDAPENLADLSRKRLMARVGVGAATLAAYALAAPFALAVGLAAAPIAAPIGMAVGLGGGVINERILTGKLKEQRAIVVASIKAGLEDRANKICITASRKLRNIYSNLAQQIEQEEKAWKLARVAAANASLSGNDHTEVEVSAMKALGKIKKLKSELTQTQEAGDE